jgi:hypothetical protein
MEQVREIIMQTISRVLGEAAFIFTDTLPAGTRPPVDSWEADGVSLQFTGTPTGRIHMWVSRGFACLVAANMLGIDTGAEEARKKGLDALMELLNMITGNFLTEAFGEKPVFTLSLPETIPNDQLADDFNDQNAVWFSADDNPVMFLIKYMPTK